MYLYKQDSVLHKDYLYYILADSSAQPNDEPEYKYIWWTLNLAGYKDINIPGSHFPCKDILYETTCFVERIIEYAHNHIYKPLERARFVTRCLDKQKEGPPVKTNFANVLRFQNRNLITLSDRDSKHLDIGFRVYIHNIWSNQVVKELRQGIQLTCFFCKNELYFPCDAIYTSTKGLYIVINNELFYIKCPACHLKEGILHK